MQLTQTLLGWLNSVFDKDPGAFLALRVRGDGTGLTWAVSDGFFTAAPVGGTALPLNLDLSEYTISALAEFIADQQGYSVPYFNLVEYGALSALVLIDSTGNQNFSNGDHIYGYTSPLWTYMEANADQLEQAAAQIDNALEQMSTTTATLSWLEYLGNFYGVPKLLGELDSVYGPRIIHTVLAPAGNNIAIAMGIASATGQPSTVVDAPRAGPGLTYNGSVNHDGSRFYNSAATREYGLFDATYSYDLVNGGDPSVFAARVIAAINTLRDAGTHLGSLVLLAPTALADSFPMPGPGADAFGFLLVQPALTDNAFLPVDAGEFAALSISLADGRALPSDADTRTITYLTTYNGFRKHDGSIPYAGGTTVTES